MLTFICKHTLQNLRVKLGLNYILMLLDITLTLSLLKTGYFREANPVMRNIVTNPFLSFLLKGVFSALLLLYLGIRMKKATDRQLRFANYLINTLNLAYLLIVGSQIFYFIIFFWYFISFSLYIHT